MFWRNFNPRQHFAQRFTAAFAFHREDHRTGKGLEEAAQNKTPPDKLRRLLGAFSGPVVFSGGSEGRREALREMLARVKGAPKHVPRAGGATGSGRARA
ncbi:hypothetical protein, partial [Klebsiella pneumoniae]|uniref:hypothetical protein n=1 Tax=Klebsiella pneumoniae TaxID=573 RepID=UPI003CCB3E15